MVTGRNVTEGEKYRITRMIVSGVKISQLLVAEVRDIRGVTTTVVMVGVGGEKLETQSVPQHGGDR